MASQKRRKAYLDPESTASVPRATKWRLSSSASGTLGSSRASRRAAVQADESPSPSNSPQPLCNNSDDESQSSWHRTDTNYADFELTGESDVDYSDWAGEDSERVTFPCGTSFSDHEDEVPSFEFEQPCDSFNVEELALPFIEGGRLTRGDAYMMLLDIAVKFGLSWTAIEAIQKLFNNLLERKAFPQSRYLFKKVCGVDMDDVVFHFYCSHCRLHLADTKGSLDERKRLHVVCDMCRTQYSGSDLVRAGSFFVSMPIKKQLASILSSKTVGSAVMSSLTR